MKDGEAALHPDLNLPKPAAEFDQKRVAGVAKRADLLHPLIKRGAGGFGVGEALDLHLRDHPGRVG